MNTNQNQNPPSPDASPVARAASTLTDAEKAEHSAHAKAIVRGINHLATFGIKTTVEYKLDPGRDGVSIAIDFGPFETTIITP